MGTKPNESLNQRKNIMFNKIIAPLFVFVAAFAAPAIASAQDAAGSASGSDPSILALAMAIAIGLAAMGGGLGQGRAVASALEGICRNPNAKDQVFVPMLLGLAFIESLVIFALVIAFIIQDM